MATSRLEAFSDAVIAIVLTIMVLELRAPHGSDWEVIEPLIRTLLAYVLSFVILGIYWNNHHHLLHTTQRVNGRILWANLHLLFWLSLFPFCTAWLSENHFESVQAATYGVVLLLAAIAYYILQMMIIAAEGSGSAIKRAIGSDLKGKASPLLYAAAIPLAFVNRWIAMAIYVFVALMWLVPDKRLEALVEPSDA